MIDRIDVILAAIIRSVSKMDKGMVVVVIMFALVVLGLVYIGGK